MPGPLMRMVEAGLGKMSALAVADRGCCFTFHRAIAGSEWPGQPNRGFHIDAAYLERLIGHLRRAGWDCVTMSEALQRTRERVGRRFVNFSIDDCYRDTVELIVPLFRRLSVPITLYVTTGIPDRLFHLRDAGLETVLQGASSVSDDGQTFAVRTNQEKRSAYHALSARWESLPSADEHYVQFCRRHGYDADELDERHHVTWPMLQAVAREPLVEIGGHTVRHRRISTLDEEAALAEIGGCRERLETMLDRRIRHFAFPYGRAGDCGPRDFDLVRRAGFESASTTRKGLVGQKSDPFCLPRNTLNGVHRRLPFAYAHLTGVSAAAARMMHRD